MHERPLVVVVVTTFIIAGYKAMFPMADAPEDPGAIVDRLKSLGLTKYEALVYSALLRVTDATATEIHGISTVPRASVYPVLAQLQEKGLVSISQSSPKRFAALPPGEGIGSLLSRIEEDAHQAQEALTAIYRQRLSTERTSQELIWNLYGIAAIRKKLIELIGLSERTVRIMAHDRLLSDEIKKALAEKSEEILVEIFTPAWDADIPPAMRVVLKKPPQPAGDLSRAKEVTAGGVFMFDERKILVVIGSGDEDTTALYSESEGFVRFFSRYYALIRDLAPQQGQ